MTTVPPPITSLRHDLVSKSQVLPELTGINTQPLPGGPYNNECPLIYIATYTMSHISSTDIGRDWEEITFTRFRCQVMYLLDNQL